MKINISMHTQENVNNKGNVCMKKKKEGKKKLHGEAATKCGIQEEGGGVGDSIHVGLSCCLLQKQATAYCLAITTLGSLPKLTKYIIGESVF